MTAVRLARVGDGGLTAEDLPLRMPQASGVIDPEPYRVRAREGPALVESFDPSGGMRCLHLPNGGDTPLFDLPDRLLTFVISGSVHVETNRGTLVLRAGDLFLWDGGNSQAGVTPGQDSRFVQVLVQPEWPGPKARALRPGSDSPRTGALPNCKRMVTESDQRSYFYDFDELFAQADRWSEMTPLIGFRFIGMAEDTFIDWHPEIVNNFVIVMAGALELEVGGTPGTVEIFRQGDICLAQDRTGEGHIDRVHGHVQVAVLIIADADLWPPYN